MQPAEVPVPPVYDPATATRTTTSLPDVEMLCDQEVVRELEDPDVEKPAPVEFHTTGMCAVAERVPPPVKSAAFVADGSMAAADNAPNPVNVAVTDNLGVAVADSAPEPVNEDVADNFGVAVAESVPAPSKAALRSKPTLSAVAPKSPTPEKMAVTRGGVDTTSAPPPENAAATARTAVAANVPVPEKAGVRAGGGERV